MKFKKQIMGLAVSALIVAGCSDSDSSETEGSSVVNFSRSEVSLASLPDLSTLAQANENVVALGLAPSGDAPTLEDIVDDVDGTVFGGVAATIVANGSATEEQRGQMERGEALCRMIQNNVEAIRQLSGGTICYMGEAGKATNGITIDTGSDTVTQEDFSGLFAQEAEDKLIAVSLGGDDGFKPHIKVLGTNTSPNAYVVQFNACNTDGDGNTTVGEYQTYTIDFDSGTYTAQSFHTHDEGGNQSKNSHTVIAQLIKNASEELEFDLSSNRTIEAQDSHSWSDNNGSGSRNVKKLITIGGDNIITTQIRENGSYDNGTDTASVWASSEIQGSGLAMRMPQAAMKMSRSFIETSPSQTHTHEGGGAVEWQDTAYNNVQEGTFYSAFEAADLTDSFYTTEPTEPSNTQTFNLCAETADIEVTWDTESESFSGASDKCDTGNNENIWDMCWSGDIQDAFQQMWNN